VGATSDFPGGHDFTEIEKNTFENDPKVYLEFRQNLEKNLHNGLRFYITGSKENDTVRAKCLETMLNRVGGDKEFLQKIIPNYPPGCKRITPSPGYLEALISPKVTCIDTPITRITITGIITADNIHRPVNAIIAATGFQNSFLPLFPTIGKNGTDLSQK
jgi:cation diffusion facilitator CzcD-associated flavoprotein CzcO